MSNKLYHVIIPVTNLAAAKKFYPNPEDLVTPFLNSLADGLQNTFYEEAIKSVEQSHSVENEELNSDLTGEINDVDQTLEKIDKTIKILSPTLIDLFNKPFYRSLAINKRLIATELFSTTSLILTFINKFENLIMFPLGHYICLNKDGNPVKKPTNNQLIKHSTHKQLSNNLPDVVEKNIDESFEKISNHLRPRCRDIIGFMFGFLEPRDIISISYYLTNVLNTKNAEEATYLCKQKLQQMTLYYIDFIPAGLHEYIDLIGKLSYSQVLYIKDVFQNKSDVKY